MTGAAYPDLASVHMTAERCKAEGIPLSEKALRRFARNGEIPAIQTGRKTLLLWSNVMEFMREGNNTTGAECDQRGQIRPIAERRALP